MKVKVYQLVEHTETGFMHYGIHEALLEGDDLYWVGSKSLRVYDNYHEAVEAWACMEPRSAFMDILDSDEAKQYYDRVDYSEVEELNFDD
jgi:hypothetical protein